MLARQTLAFKLVATGIAFLLLALASIVLTLWVTWQLEGGAAAVNEAGRMRMMSYRMTLDAVSGRPQTVAEQLRAMDATIDLLDAGDPSRPLFVPWTDESRAEFAQVRREWQGLRAALDARPPVAGPMPVASMVGHVDRFVTLIEQRLSRWTEILRVAQFTMVGLAIAGAVLMLYASHRMVLDPLRRLGDGMGAIRGGDFAARVQVVSNDEFGELAGGFNAMAARLESVYDELEAKVREKTARLESKRERMAALYEVSAFVAQADNLDDMARGFVGMVRPIARADAITVRWSDDGNRHYLMLAQEGLPPLMSAKEQCLPSGQCGCGQAATSAATRTIAIHAAGMTFGHCARAGFETMLAVPVKLHHRVLGEINLFYRRAHELDDEERSLIETLASHLAAGIESLRAAAADRESAVAGERALLAQELHDSIAQSLAFLKIQVELLRTALRRGDSVAAGRTVDEIDTGVRESYADVRELLLHFRTRTDAQDIEAALRSTLRKFEQQTGLAAELQIDGHGVPLPADVQVQVLHVVQEALSNVRKHANATTVHLKVQQAPQWRFEVCDDGRGFDPDETPDDSHVGLRIMKERASRIGAQVTVRSSANQGTQVAITVPREAVPQEMHA